MRASARALVPDERLDRLIHALAQLPQDFELEVTGDGPDRSRLWLMVDAYGLGQRVRIGPRHEHPEGLRGFRVFPSLRNLASAPVRPGDDGAESILWQEVDHGSSPGGITVVRSMAELLDHVHPGTEPAPVCSSVENLTGQRVAVVTNIPAHYRIPLFNGVAKRLADQGASLRVFFLADTYARRAWMVPDSIAFDHLVLRSMGLSFTPSWHPFLPYNLGRELRRFSPTLVITGGFSPLVSGRVALFAGRRAIPFGLWSGEIAARQTARRLVRTITRRALVSRAAFALSYGSTSAAYLAEMRPDLPVVFGRNTIDTDTLMGSPRREHRREVTRILTVADMSAPGKRLDIVLDALSLVRDSAWKMTVVGGGPNLDRIRETYRHLGEKVEFLGSVRSTEVPAYFRGADLFVFPSQFELFGLVIVEAMAAGLASVVSATAGAVADLCVSGKNCLVVASTAPSAWAAEIDRLLSDRELRLGLGAAARRTIESRWTLEHSIDAFVAGVRLGVIAGSPRGSGKF